MKITKEIFFVSSVVALVNIGLTIIFPILPFYLKLFGGGTTEFGYIASSYAFAILVFSPVMGRLADKFGKVRIIVLNLVGYGLSNFLYLFVTHYIHIVAIRFIGGIFTGGVIPAAISLTSDLSETDNRARSIAFVTAGVSFGIIIGPVLGGTLIEYYPLWVPFVISGILALIAAVVGYLILSEPDLTEVEVSNSDISELQKIKSLPSILPKPVWSFIIYLLIQFFITVSWLMIQPGYLFYFYDVLGHSPQQFGILVMVYGVMVFVGEIVFGGVSDRVGRKPVIFIGAIINASFYTLLAFLHSFIFLLLAAVMAGIAIGIMGPPLNALLSEVTHPDRRTFIFSIVTSITGVAQIVGPLFGGWYIDQASVNLLQLTLFSTMINLVVAIISLSCDQFFTFIFLPPAGFVPMRNIVFNIVQNQRGVNSNYQS